MCAIMAEKLDQSITFPFRREVEYLFANPVMDKELYPVCVWCKALVLLPLQIAE